METKRYKPSQAASLLGVSAWTMRKWIREGIVPAIKNVHGRWFVDASWIDSQVPEHGKASVGDLQWRQSVDSDIAAIKAKLEDLEALIMVIYRQIGREE